MGATGRCAARHRTFASQGLSGASLGFGIAWVRLSHEPSEVVIPRSQLRWSPTEVVVEVERDDLEAGERADDTGPGVLPVPLEIGVAGLLVGQGEGRRRRRMTDIVATRYGTRPEVLGPQLVAADDESNRGSNRSYAPIPPAERSDADASPRRALPWRRQHRPREE